MQQTGSTAPSPQDVAEQLWALGVQDGTVLLVHTSYRAVRPVEGGPEGLIEGLRRALGVDGTLVMPSFTGDDDALFDPATTPASPDLGVVADVFWRMPGVRRSDHPFACAALGPQADRITADPVAFPPHVAASPVGRVWQLDGQVLLIGVGQDANTTLHLAELTAGVPYRVPKHITLPGDGRPRRVDYQENDHCCQRFTLLDDWLRPTGLLSEGPVGKAQCRLMRSRDVVAIAGAQLAQDPTCFLHARGSDCEACESAWRSLPI